MITRTNENISHTDLLRALSRPRLPLQIETLTPGDLRQASEPVADRLPTREEAEADIAAQLAEDRESESRERMHGICAEPIREAL